MMPLFCCLFLLLGQSLASPSANQYVDTVIHGALQNVIRSEKLDPTHLPNYSFEYQDKTFLGKVKGKADYTEGTLSGLSGVQRHFECQGPRNISGSTTINCSLTINTLQTSYTGKVKYGVLPKVTIHAKGNVQNSQVQVEFSKPFNGRPQVNFRSINVRPLATDFTGLGPLNKNMKVLENNYRERVGSEIISVIHNRFRYALEMAASNVPMPLR